ncbi:MAG: tRNA glutamyl-Q(34) synthetase GluQRS [Betaproteobacteria bacterium]|nr:tRNA glutamyl-Q(34) synthetase GluQRS [Betaproteobacteria bacterium]MDE2003023.1 tRNA glutamyl-Q(34) synthetase GluQRS [Betaproteobacteria bacterium]MDE2210953.1 tRNA glutamyl-Q(34) synthetase GluQRS [Betaproteobacteria bacterium]
MAATVAGAAARYRGRFAPSPTGDLHFGSLVAALASHADARAAGGQWLLRIEDVDIARVRAGASDAILATLERFGFTWDGPVWRQSLRGDVYAAALERLHALGLLYACACSRRELAGVKPGAIGERVYPGFCRDRALRPGFSQAADSGFAWRLRVPAAPVGFVDRHYGPQSQDLAADVGDFILRRRDGLYAYQLAVVVDDAEQGISDVVRGADLLASTARQIYLQRSLGCATPRYLHVPVAVDAQGNKLSKQFRAPALAGDPLPTLLAAWRFLGQPAPAEDPASVAAFWAFAISSWDPRRLPRAPVVPAPPTFGGRPAPSPQR